MNIYLHFPRGIDNIFREREIAIKHTKDLQMMIDLADCEKNSKLFYCKSEKDNFIEDLIVVDEILNNIGGYDFETAINILINDSDVKNILHKEETNCSYSIFEPSINDLDRDIPDLFKEIAKRRLDNSRNNFLVINAFRLHFTSNSILIIKNQAMQSQDIVEIPSVTRFVDLDTWLQGHRCERHFNNTDERHIETSPRYIKGKSPLLRGIAGRSSAENLLKAAIGDKRETEDLMNFDEVNDNYIWYEFENENPQNQYHAYHLVKPNSHERDIKAIEKIPQRVKKLLEYRKSAKPQ